MIATEGELIERIGGNVAVAELLGVKHNTVSGWRNRGFPPWARVRLQRLAAERKIAVDPGLLEIKRPQRQSAA